MALTTAPLLVRIFINTHHPNPTKQNGWSERIPIWETRWEQALPIALAIAKARKNILAKNTYIQWVSLAMVEYPWYEQAVIDAPLLPLPQWDIVGVDAAGLWWEFNNEEGEIQGRLFRAIDRNEFGQMRWNRGPFPLPRGISPLPPDPTLATKDQLFANTFTTFREYFGILRRTAGVIGRGATYDLHRSPSAYYMRVSQRTVGRPYKRQSWEAVPWSSAPPFSPCGEVTGVGRNAFVVQCRFYPGGPVQLIHYYEARPDAHVFPLPHIFWGRFRDEDLYNSFGVGELTGNARRWWVPFGEYGNAPGDHYSGPVSGFVGQYLPTWMPTVPTPIPLRPACDNPASKNELVTYGGFCVCGPGIGWTKVG